MWFTAKSCQRFDSPYPRSTEPPLRAAAGNRNGRKVPNHLDAFNADEERHERWRFASSGPSRSIESTIEVITTAGVTRLVHFDRGQLG